MDIESPDIFQSCEDLFQALQKPVFITDFKYSLVYANEYFFKLINGNPKKLIKKNVGYILSKHIDKDLEKYQLEILDSTIPFIFTADGHNFLCHTIPIIISKTTYSVFILDNANVFDLLFNKIQNKDTDTQEMTLKFGVSFLLCELEGKIIDFSNNITKFLGYSRQELEKKKLTDLDVSLTTKELKRLLSLSNHGASLIFPRILKTKLGGLKPVRIYSRFMEENNKKHLLLIIQPNQDYEDLEYAVKHRLLYDGIVSETKSILFGLDNDTEKMKALLRFYASKIECDNISIHFIDTDKNAIMSTSHNPQLNFSDKYDFEHFVPWLQKQFRLNPVLQINKISEIPDTLEDYRQSLKKHQIIRQFYFAIHLKDTILGFIQVDLSNDKSHFSLFSHEILKVLSELLLQYTQYSNKQNIQHQFQEKIKQTFYEMINAVVKMVEERDPYTAGHQLRVAALAKQIAQTMGLTERQVNDIHLASMVHDIGKIKIPAEILSVPRKLSNTERALMETHPVAGFEILKNIQFESPIQRFVLDHHERLDGSGYPSGKKGNEIDTETLIISVADVYEAMISHRPYRPGIPIDKALSELKKNAGILYDSEVVNAFFEVILVQEFKFPPQYYQLS